MNETAFFLNNVWVIKSRSKNMSVCRENSAVWRNVKVMCNLKRYSLTLQTILITISQHVTWKRMQLCVMLTNIVTMAYGKGQRTTKARGLAGYKQRGCDTRCIGRSCMAGQCRGRPTWDAPAWKSHPTSRTRTPNGWNRVFHKEVSSALNANMISTTKGWNMWYRKLWRAVHADRWLSKMNKSVINNINIDSITSI